MVIVVRNPIKKEFGALAFPRPRAAKRQWRQHEEISEPLQASTVVQNIMSKARNN